MSNWKCGNVNISIWSSLHNKDKDYPGHGSMVVRFISIYVCNQSKQTENSVLYLHTTIYCISIWSSLHSKDKDYPGHGSMVVRFISTYVCNQYLSSLRL